MRTGIARLYYYGEKKWDDYLLDIQEAQDDAREAAQETAEEMNEELRKQTELLDRQVELSAEIRDHLREMKLEIQWGFGLVVDRLDKQTKLVSDIAQTLGEIHQTLKSPLITQATELWQLGEDYFKRGLLDRALEKFLQSEQKNDVFFPLQLRIGTLFLEGRNSECNVINLPEAERHLLIAARYALAEQKVTENAIEYAGKAYYRAAQAAYLIGADCQRCGNVEGVKECLERALAHLVKAAKYWPAFRGVLFLRAKCYALLENKQEALECIRILSDSDRTFHSAAMEDGDFATIRQNVDGVFRLAIDRPGPNASKARDVIAHARIILNWAKTSKPQSEANERVIEAKEQELNVFEEQLGTLAVDIESGTASILRSQAQLEDIVWKHLWKRSETLSDRIKSLRSERAELEKVPLNMMNGAFLIRGDSAMGCLFVVLMYIALPIVLPIIALPWKSTLSRIPMGFSGGILFLAGLVGYGFLTFAIGKRLSLLNQKRTLNGHIDRAKSAIREWDRVHVPEIERAEADEKEVIRRQQDFAVLTASDSD
jgi:tetratricopeptide (TPR) repeat protein